MGNINFKDIIFEVLLGMVFTISILPAYIYLNIDFYLAISSSSSLNGLTCILSNYLPVISISNVTIFILSCYFLGILLHGVTFAIDEYFLQKLVEYKLENKAPELNDKKLFWKSVGNHVLQYRTHQWDYYSLFKNILILLIFGNIIWFIFLYSLGHIWIAIVVSVILLTYKVLLFLSMRKLLNLYNLITISCGNTNPK